MPIEENAGATAVGLSSDEIAELNSLDEFVGVHGDRYNEMQMGFIDR